MTVRVAFTDFWGSFKPETNLFTKLMRRHASIKVVTERPDLCFFSNFGRKPYRPDGHFAFMGEDCIKVFFTGENISANFNHCDYAIGFDPIVFGDRYLRCPLYTIYDEYQQICEPRAALTRQDLDARDGFCGYVVSASTHSAPHRGDAFAAFDAARGVASGGRHLRNTDALMQLEQKLPGAQAKAQFLGRYRFSMAYENASHPGYCTEKIVQSFAARTIPIYWGDPLVTEDFNPAAFVNANEFASLDALVAEVLRIEDDTDVCLKMLNAPVFQPGRSGVHLAELEAFLARLVTTPASDLRRRALHGSGARIDARAARAARSFWRR